MKDGKIKSTESTRKARLDQSARLLVDIESLCVEIGVGGKVPTHRELMRRFGASERMVLSALDDLRRRRWIERHYGSGTYVSERQEGDALTEHSDSIQSGSRIVVIASPDPFYFDRCVKALHTLVLDKSLSLLFLPMDPSAQIDLDLGRIPDAKYCIVYSRRFLPLVRRLQAQGRRAVCIGTPEIGEQAGVPMVMGNQERGGALLTNHLLELGHTRLAFVGDDLSKLSPRWRGIELAIAHATRRGIDARVDIADKFDLLNLLEREPAKARTLLLKSGQPTAYLFWNDDQAARYMMLMLDAGIKIPEDISVTGYDAAPQFGHLRPTLTTIEPFLHEQQQVALDLVTSGQPLAPETSAIIIPRIAVGGSTGTQA